MHGWKAAASSILSTPHPRNIIAYFSALSPTHNITYNITRLYFSTSIEGQVSKSEYSVYVAGCLPGKQPRSLSNRLLDDAFAVTEELTKTSRLNIVEERD